MRALDALGTLIQRPTHADAAYWRQRAERLERDAAEAQELASEIEKGSNEWLRIKLRREGESDSDMMRRLAEYAADRGMLDVEYAQIAELTGFRPSEVYSTGLGSPPQLGTPA